MPGLKTAGLLIFFVAFVGIVAWLVFGRPGYFKSAARIPLDDEE